MAAQEPDAKRKPDGAVRTGVLFGMGNPLLDISAEVQTSLLEKYGLEANNAILAEDKHQPIYEELVKDYSVDYIAGGATQKSIRVAQWILQERHATTYVGCIGKDTYGEQLTSKASGDGVNVNYLIDESVPTGTCAVLITGKSRSMVANLAAANHYKKDHLVQENIWQLVTNAGYYYIGGFFLTVSPESILEVGKHAAAENKPFTFNLSAPFISQFFKKPLMKTLPYVDILFGNETEMAQFGKDQGFEVESLEEIGLKIAALPKENKNRDRTVVITQGCKPTLVISGGKVQRFPVHPIDKDAIVDTNGAGDAFVGGYISQLVQDKPVDECVQCGLYAAKIIIQRSGCTYPEKPSYP